MPAGRRWSAPRDDKFDYEFVVGFGQAYAASRPPADAVTSFRINDP